MVERCWKWVWIASVSGNYGSCCFMRVLCLWWVWRRNWLLGKPTPFSPLCPTLHARAVSVMSLTEANPLHSVHCVPLFYLWMTTIHYFIYPLRVLPHPSQVSPPWLCSLFVQLPPPSRSPPGLSSQRSSRPPCLTKQGFSYHCIFVLSCSNSE